MRHLTFAFLTLILISCNGRNSDKENVEIIEKYITSVENLDYETMKSLLAPNYMGYGPSYGDSINKEQALQSWKYNVENIYKSIKYNKSRNTAVTINSGPNKGEWVSNWGELHIVYKNNIGEVTIWANSIYKIEHGKIAKSYTFYNEADALRQLGYIFAKPDDICE